jgi:glucose-1-phosphate adenylyltransferase
MNFRHLLKTHRDSRADVTIAVLPVAADATPGFGIVRLDDTGRVIGFIEKPKSREQLAPFATPESWIAKRGIQAHGRQYLASMGIYLFSRDALFHLLNAQPPATDFGREIFPRSIQTHRVQAYLFDGYWEDVGTIKAYHEANLALCEDNPPFIFHSHEGVIYTRMRYLPASRISDAHLDQCLVSDGCVIERGTRIHHCVVGLRNHIGRNCTLRDSVIIGADRYETDTERDENERRGLPNMGVGEGTVIERAILDKDCRIGANVKIINHQNEQDAEGRNFVIRDGIVVIPKGAVVLDGTVI